MKKNININYSLSCAYLLALLALLFCGCGGDDEPAGPVETFITPAATEFEFGCDAVYKEISIEANTEWGAKSSASWLSCTKMNEQKLAIAVAEHMSWTEDRVDVVSLFDEHGEAKATITIKQLKKESAPYKTYTVNGVEFKMIVAAGGTFKMGATREQEKYTIPRDDEYPVHEVTLSDFCIGETEVTQALWYAVMGEKPTKDGYKWTTQYGIGDNYPAYYISDDDCLEFIEKLNALTGETFRLPTEAEWEYAARGGARSKGFVFSGSNTVGSVAWYSLNSRDRGTAMHEVATMTPNELGIHDMSGNVFEWVSDWYSSRYSSEPQTNPTGPAECSYRRMRGGSWISLGDDCRNSCRGLGTHGERSFCGGMRLASSN